MTDPIIAVDLGGTQVRVARCDSTGKIIDRMVQPANADGRFGTWKWAVSRNPVDIKGVLEKAVATP